MAQRSIFAEIRKLLSHTVVYGLGNYSTRVLGFFLIPVYTRYLVPADYGILSLANMISNLLFIVLNLGQSTAFFRSYFDHDDVEGRRSVISTSVLLILSYSLPLGALLLLFAHPLAGLVFGEPVYAGLFVLVCLGTMSNVLLRLPFAVLRAEEKATRYATLSLARGLTAMVVALVLVVGLDLGVAGVVWGQFVSHFGFLLLLLPGVLWGVHWQFSKPTAKHLVSYGTPLVFAGIATFILNLSNRYFLKHYATLHELGLYSLGYNFGEALFLLVTAMRLAYPPFVLSNMKSPDAPHLYRRLLTYYVMGMGLVALAVSLISREVIQIMAAPSYHEAYRVVPFLVLAQVFHGFSFLSPVGLMIKRKPIFRTISVFVAAGINVVLNYLWIPTYGMMGAAWATLVAFAIQSSLVTGFSLRLYPLQLEYGRMLKVAVIAGALYWAGTLISPDASVWFSLAAKMALIALYPCLLVGLGFFELDERQSAAELLRTVRGRLGFAPQRS